MAIVRIGQAGLNEWGGTHGGEAGNQTRTGVTAEHPEGNLDGELNVRTWYSKPWDYCIRAKDTAIAEKIADTMYKCVANKNIGYDQNERTTLYTQMVKHNWDATKVGLCETDCSALVSVCVNAAGIPLSKDVYTGNLHSSLMNTNKFIDFTDSAHCSELIGLMRGDILVKEGSHTIIVLDDFRIDPDYNIKYQVVNGNVYLRSGPGSQYNALTVLNCGQILYGSDDEENGFINVIYDQYTGWSSKNYLKKIGEDPIKEPFKVLTVANVYLRADAGTEYSVLTSIPANTELICDGTMKQASTGTIWYKLSYNGYTGYSSSAYCKKVATLAEIDNNIYG